MTNREFYNRLADFYDSMIDGASKDEGASERTNLPDIAQPGIPGHEYSGVIEEIGSKVKGYKIGDRIGAFKAGGLAEFIPLQIRSRVHLSPFGGQVFHATRSREAPHSSS